MASIRILLAFFLLPICASAQLQVDLSDNPQSIVQNQLLGEGVDLIDVSFNGQSGTATNPQIGTFSNGWEAIGISDGIIIATGQATIAEGPNDLPTAYEAIEEDDELTEDVDLAELMGASAEINDAAVLEFDFVASGDTLRFSYVFASEEYNEHTCSPYNDAFGFFISGPGITGDGTFTNNAINVAKIPERDVPVAINTVNRGIPGTYGSMAICNGADINWQENSQYFVDNESNTSLNTTQFDGFTTVFTVEVPVECGGTYHIKMAIADAVDGKNDSAVFIKSGSFASQAPLEVDYEVLNPVNSQAIEGCSSYAFKLVRNDSTNTKVVYLKSEMAFANPEVFPDFPDSLVFYPQQGYLNWELPIHHDGVFDGERIIDISFLQPEVCGLDTAETSLALSFTDAPPIDISYQDSLIVTCDEVGLVDIQVIGGIPPYSIEWEENYSGYQFELNGQEPLTIQAMITDQCDLNQEDVSIIYEPIQYDALEVVLPEMISINCLEPLLLEPWIIGGRGDYSYRWIFEDNMISESSELEVQSPEEGQLSLIVNDGCVAADTVMTTLELLQNPVSAEIGEDFQGFCNEEVTIVPQVEGGFGALTFKWKRNFALQSSAQSFTFTPISSSIVSLQVIDECGQQAFDTLNIFVDHDPIQIGMPSDTMICEGRRLVFTPEVYGGVGEYDYFWIERESDTLPLNIIPRRDETYTLRVTDECLKTAEESMNVSLVAVEAEFEFDYDSDSRPIMNLSADGLNYFWVLPGGETSTLFEPIFQPDVDQDQLVSLEVTHPVGCSDSKIDFYEPPLNVFVPSAFTPDGDGLNDIFKAEGTFINEFELWVFDRWGNVVFHSKSPKKGWDGSDPKADFAAQNLVYNYRVLAKGFNSQIIDKKGSVTVVR
ncbi:choice-of-anchor L domain-containing protein [Cryomorphaceae bacterium 1068]|nr:choice-of-anchor L domain-containing protein [Cryomorphaceae bacterium 1068]